MESKTYFISADLEGVTDVTAWCETEKGGDGYEAARMQMSREVAADMRAPGTFSTSFCPRGRS